MHTRLSRALCGAVTAVLLSAPVALAQDHQQANYDEARVGTYTLPDPLILQNGQKVTSADRWFHQRRPEILRLFQEDEYGRSPGRPRDLSFRLVERNDHALGGTAIREQVTIRFSRRQDSPAMHLLLYLPAHARKPVPVFLGLNFSGNQAVARDPGILLGTIWDGKTKTSHPADPATRGKNASRWPVDLILEHGFGVATAYYGDIEPDFDGGLRYGVRSLYLKPGQTTVAPDEWGAIGAWAWGLSRALDYLETNPLVDAHHVAVIGHSRLAKTALWAGAQDQRFWLVVSNEAGEGGAALSHRSFGETIKRINTSFPHWFCANYKRYNDHIDQLPFDQHMLMALIAPRPLYVASAAGDLWSDPHGEFLSEVAAGPVYRLLGKKDLGTDQWPAVSHPIMHTLAYHVRPGRHDITPYDWEQYLTFAQMQLRGTWKMAKGR